MCIRDRPLSLRLATTVWAARAFERARLEAARPKPCGRLELSSAPGVEAARHVRAHGQRRVLQIARPSE
eukprot:10505619-Alexandrium_andersonii.AAC.1